MYIRKEQTIITKYTAIWAFSESVFGGVMHALKIPFTGLLLGGLAIIFLSLTNDLVENKRELLKVTFLVIMIKFLFSPNTPFTAYLAVLMQGIFAFVIFSYLKSRTISILVLSFLSEIWSALQKILITTLFLGMNFWYSIDEISRYMAKISGFNLGNDFSMSLFLISLYFLLHLAGAGLFSFITIRLPDYIEKHQNRIEQVYFNYILKNESELNFVTSIPQNKANKSWYKKPGRLLFVLFLIFVSILTLIDPTLKKILLLDIISMIIRASILIYLWFNVISPFMVNQLMNVLKKSKYINGNQMKTIEDIKGFFPGFRTKINLAWEIHSNQKKLHRLKNFFRDSILLLLITK